MKRVCVMILVDGTCMVSASSCEMCEEGANWMDTVGCIHAPRSVEIFYGVYVGDVDELIAIMRGGVFARHTWCVLSVDEVVALVGRIWYVMQLRVQHVYPTAMVVGARAETAIATIVAAIGQMRIARVSMVEGPSIITPRMATTLTNAHTVFVHLTSLEDLCAGVHACGGTSRMLVAPVDETGVMDCIERYYDNLLHVLPRMEYMRGICINVSTEKGNAKDRLALVKLLLPLCPSIEWITVVMHESHTRGEIDDEARAMHALHGGRGACVRVVCESEACWPFSPGNEILLDQGELDGFSNGCVYGAFFLGVGRMLDEWGVQQQLDTELLLCVLRHVKGSV